MIDRLKQLLFKEYNLIFFLSVAIILGPAISILFANDLSQYTDCYSYLGLAEFNFDQNPVRRYRVLVPFAAAALHFLSGGWFNKLAPGYYTGNFSLAFSFFLMNSALMGLFGVLVYRYCRAFKVSRPAALVGLLLMLSSRYTTYFAALPFIDSLFCMTIATSLVGIEEKNDRLLLLSIFLGPFAKEAFIFIAPVIFFYSHMPKPRLLLYFLLSGFLVFSFHFLIDHYFPSRHMGWVKADIGHVIHIKKYLPMLFSFYGIYKIAIGLGLWLFPLLLALFVAPLRTMLKKRMGRYTLLFFLMILLQLLLSGSMERMFYQAMPLLSLMMALLFDDLKRYIRYRPARDE